MAGNGRGEMRLELSQEEYLKRFKKILDEMYELTKIKNDDYAEVDNALSNITFSEEVGLPAEWGIIARMGDKYKRIGNILIRKKGESSVKDEQIRETIMDNAVYSIILMIICDLRLEKMKLLS